MQHIEFLFRLSLVIFSYLLVIILPIEGALLLALLTIDRRAILNLRIGTALALVPYESGYYVTVLAGGWLAVSLNILFALFTDCTCTAFWGLLKFWTTICTFHDWKCPTTLLIRTKLHMLQNDKLPHQCHFRWYNTSLFCIPYILSFHLALILQDCIHYYKLQNLLTVIFNFTSIWHNNLIS